MTTKWSIADFEILRVVGVGYSGKVMAVSEKKTAKIFAIKVIRKCRSKGKRYLQQSVHERNIMARIAAINYRDQDIPIDGEGCRCLLEWGTGNSCPFLIKMYSAFQDEKNLFFVMDYHRSGDLGDLLDVHLRFSEDHARLFAAEIVLGISQLHACNIIHRDMKPSNILISDRGDIVLSDFGLGRLFSTSSPLLEYSSNDAVCVLLEKRIADSFCGTPEYIAPEIICRCPYDEGVDWWSFGTVLYEMLVGVVSLTCL